MWNISFSSDIIETVTKKMTLRTKHCVTFCNLPVLIKQSCRRLFERQTVAQRARGVARCFHYTAFALYTVISITQPVVLSMTCRNFCYCFHVIYFHLFLPGCLQSLTFIKTNNTRMNGECDFLSLFKEAHNVYSKAWPSLTATRMLSDAFE